MINYEVKNKIFYPTLNEWTSKIILTEWYIVFLYFIESAREELFFFFLTMSFMTEAHISHKYIDI